MTTLQRFRSLCNAVQPVINRLWSALRPPVASRRKGRQGWGAIEPLETRQLLNSIFVIGSEGADNISVQLSGGSTVQVYVNNVLYASDTVSGSDTVTINARGGNDSIVVGLSNATSVLPGTLRIHGGSGSNTLDVIGQTTVTLDTNLPDVGVPGFGGTLSLTVQGSSVVNFPQNQTLASLRICDTARVNLTKSNVAANSPHKTLVTGSLQLLQGGTLDLTDNALIVHSGNRNDLTSHIARGRNNGNWQGSGIISSAIVTQTQGLMMLGLLKNSDKQSPFTNFNGQGVAPGDVLIKYTYNGDATLDSVVDAGDYFRIDTGNIIQEAAWYNGDFDYDGDIDDADYAFINNVYQNYPEAKTPLTPLISGADSVAAGAPYTLPLSCSTNAGNSSINGWTIYWGDGRYSVVSGNPGSISHTYAQAGTYRIIAAVQGTRIGYYTLKDNVQVTSGQPPLSVSMTSVPGSSAEGSAVTLGTSLTNTTGQPPQYAWNITPPSGKTYTLFGLGTSSNLTFYPNDNGDYLVSVQAMAGDCSSPIDTRTISITNVAPSSLALNLNGGNGTVGQSFNLSGNFSDPGSNDTHRVTINWGDGPSGPPIELGAGVLSFSTSHVYNSAGTYTITASVSDDDGGGTSGSATATIRVAGGVSYVWQAGTYDNQLDLVAGTLGVNGFSGLDYADSGCASIPLGSNSFTFYRTPWTGNYSLFVSPNGLITFGGNGLTYTQGYTNTDLTGYPTLPAIAVAWDHLYTSTNGILYKFDNNRLIIEWNNVRPCSSYGSMSTWVFQAILELNTGSEPGRITFNYVDLDSGDGNSNGASATVGITDGGSNRLLIAKDRSDHPNIRSGQAICITGTRVNTPPTVNPLSLSATSINESDTVTLTGSFSDPDTGDVPDLLIDWGDGETTPLNGYTTKSFTAQHRYRDDKPLGTSSDMYTVRVTVDDKHGGVGSSSTPITVRNVAPSDLTFNGGTVLQGDAFTLAGSFLDPGEEGTFTINVNWGDNNTSSATATRNPTSGRWEFTASHPYDNPGTYTVVATVTDDDGGSISAGAGGGSGYRFAPCDFEDIDLRVNDAGVSGYLAGVDFGGACVPLGSNEFNCYGTRWGGSDGIFNLGSDGVLSVGRSNYDYLSYWDNTDLSSTPVKQTIAPLWDNWNSNSDSTLNGWVLSKFDTANNRLIIEWDRVGITNGVGSASTVTFQAIFQLNTGSTPGDIIFNYVDLDTGESNFANGVGATVGVKDTNSSGLVVSYNQASPYVGTRKAIRFHWGDPPTTVKVNAAPPLVSVNATDASASEPGADTGTFTISRTGSTALPLTVYFNTGGTAAAGSDYTSPGASLTIPAGASSATLTLTPLDDDLLEVPETVILTLSPNAAYRLSGQSSASITLADDDANVTIVDNAASSGVRIDGDWVAATDIAGFYGSNCLHDNNGGKGSKSVLFIPTPALDPGTYQVFLRWTSGSDRATNVPVDVLPAGDPALLTVNERTGGGAWYLLGTYTFAASGGSVRIRTDGTDGLVVADAVRFKLITPDQAPSIGSLSASPGTVMAGSMLTLTASGASDPDGTISQVRFYRETNGQTGLQTGPGGDMPLGTVCSSPYSLDVASAGLTAGTYTYYAQASDNLGRLSGAISTTNVAVAPDYHSAPTVAISGPAVGFAGKALTFAAHVEQDPGITNLSSYPLTYQWRLLTADGLTELSNPASDESKKSTFVFVTPATLTSAVSYQVELTVTEGNSSLAVTQRFGFRVDPAPASNDFDWGIVSVFPEERQQIAGIHELYGIGLPEVVVQQEDGKILVAGRATLAINEPLDSHGRSHPAFIARFNKDLTLDTSFGPDHLGTTTVDFVESTDVGSPPGFLPYLDSGFSFIYGMAINPANQSIVVVGAKAQSDLTGSRLVVARYLSTGIPDLSFNNGKPFSLDPSRLDASGNAVSAGFSVVVLGDGSILVGGATATQAASDNQIVDDSLLIKLHSDGSPDTSFNNGTRVAERLGDVALTKQWDTGSDSTNLKTAGNWPYGIHCLRVLDNGQVLAAGTAREITRQDTGGGTVENILKDTGFFLIRYNVTAGVPGTIDHSFGDGGRAFIPSSESQNGLPGIARLEDMKVVGSTVLAAGATAGVTGSGNQWTIDAMAHVTLATYDLQGHCLLPLKKSEPMLPYGVAGVCGPKLGQGYAITIRSDGAKIMAACSNTTASDQMDGSGWALVRLDSGTLQLDTNLAEGDAKVVVPAGIPRSITNEFAYAAKGLLATDEGIISVGALNYHPYGDTCSWTAVLTRYRSRPKPAVSNVIATVASGAVTLTWTNSGFGQDGFEIKRSGSESGPFVTIGWVGPNQNDFVDVPSPSDGVYNYYRVVPYFVTDKDMSEAGVSYPTGSRVPGAAPGLPAHASDGTTPQGATVRQIVSPSFDDRGLPTVISSNTPIRIIAANSSNVPTSWALSLVSSATNERTLLASSNASLGQWPNSAALAVVLNPALYPDGRYTLELTDSSTSTTFLDRREILIQTAAKAGNLAFSTTDGTFSTPLGPISISRVYNSSRADQPGLLGYGWTLSLLDAQLHTTARPDIFDHAAADNVPALRAGDLVYLTVPNDGPHVFEFAPIALNQTEKFNNSITGIAYWPRFIALDGSDATLSASWAGYPVVYVPADDEYVRGVTSWCNQGLYSPSSYQLTTKDGICYTIKAATGRITEASRGGYNKITYNYDGSGPYIANGVITLSGGGDTLLTIHTVHDRITSIAVPGKASIGYENTSGDLTSVTDQDGKSRAYLYGDPANSHCLTQVNGPSGTPVLKASYDSTTGQLTTVTDANKHTISVSCLGLGAGQVVEVVTDAGRVVENVYDERFGTLLRKIEAVTDASGDLTGYRVTVRKYSYAINDLSRMSALQDSGVYVLESIEDYAPLDVAASNKAEAYTRMPAPNTWIKRVVYNTSDDKDDPARGQIVSMSERLDANGTLRTTRYEGYKWIIPASYKNSDELRRELVKPQLTTVTIYTPNANPPESVQSRVFTDYDEYGYARYSVTAVASNPDSKDYYPAQGTAYEYVDGRLKKTRNKTVSIKLTSDGTLEEKEDSSSTTGPLTTNEYYEETQNTSNQTYAGELYGQVQYTENAAGERTYYGYDTAGHTVLSYTLKFLTNDAGSPLWTDGNGKSIGAWVGTTNVYNAQGLVTDTYQATYKDSDADQELDIAFGGPAGIYVAEGTEPAYAGPLLTVHNEYNAKRQLESSTDEYNGVTRYTYDLNGHVIRQQNPDGTEVRTVYDELGRAIWTTNPFVPANSIKTANLADNALLTHTIYDSLGQVTGTERYRDGIITIPEDGNPSQVARPGTILSSTAKVYDASGRVVETKDASGLRTGTTYYPDGRVHHTGPLQTGAPGNWYEAGEPLQWFRTQVEAGCTYTLVTTYSYDQVTSLPADAVSAGAVSYDSVQDALDRATSTYKQTTKTYKDSLGRTILTIYADNTSTQTLYGFGNRAVAGYGVSGQIIKGRQETQIDQLGHVTDYFYDLAGNLTDIWQPKVTDAKPSSPTYGQLVRPHTSYVYDTAGNEVLQIDANQQPAFQSWITNGNSPQSFTGTRTSFAYDQNGNQIKRTLPAVGGATVSESWTYNSHGRIQTHVDFNGNTATYSYYPSGDAHAGMLQQVVYVGAAGSGKATQTVSYTYDSLGRQQTVIDASGTTTYVYDVDGNVVQEATPEGTINYAYDLASGQLIRTWTANTETAYGYDDLGRLENVYVLKLNGTATGTCTGWNSATHEPILSGSYQTTSYGYDPVGNKASESLPNGVATTYTYDALNRLKGLQQKQGTTTLFSQDYILNSNGTRDSVSETQRQPDGSAVTRSLTWAYDALDRLTGEVLTTTAANQNYSDTFAYDLASNRMNKTHAGPGGGDNETITYHYNERDQLTSETSIINGLTEYEYDLNGSQTKSKHNGVETVYGYDVRNRLASVTGGGTTTTYGYDDAGNRVSETSGGVSSYYLTDTANPSGYAQPLEVKNSPTAMPSMTYLLGDRVFGQAGGSSSPTSYLLPDGHGSTRALMGSGSNPTATYNYDAFGGALGFTASTASTVFLFGGDAVYDPASGLYLHGNGIRARSGFRFLSMDSYAGDSQDPLSLHKYLYVSANPIMNADPSGNSLLSIAGGVVAGVGIAVQVAGAAMAGYGLATSVISGYEYIQATYGLMTADAGDFDKQIYYSTMQADALQGMISGLKWTAAGAAVAWVGGIMYGAGLAMMAAGGTRAAMEGLCFVAGTPVLLGDGQTKLAIDQIHIGQRVATDGGVANSADGKTAAGDPNFTEVDPATWRLVTIAADDWEVQTLVSPSWIEAHGVTGGACLPLVEVLDLAEMGVPDDLVGTVESISPCPPIESGYGRVVLTTVSHLNVFVFNLTLSDDLGNIDNLGVTGWHKFYTEDRGWVSASELYLGETVRTAHGDVMVTELTREPGVYRVYNITVEADHVYYVGDLTALTHNVGCSVDGWIPDKAGGWKQVFMKNWTPADEQAFANARAAAYEALPDGLSQYERMQRMSQWVKHYLETHKK